MAIDDLIDAILAREGGYVHHPDDRGGPTKFGITADTLRAWRRKPVDTRDVKELTRQEAGEIYRALYIERPNFDRIADPSLRHLVVDAGVHAGPVRAARWLQDAVGVGQDGIVGPVTLQALDASDPAIVYRKVLSSRARFYGQIITRHREQAGFAAGWLARLAWFIEQTPLESNHA